MPKIYFLIVIGLLLSSCAEHDGIIVSQVFGEALTNQSGLQSSVSDDVPMPPSSDDDAAPSPSPKPEEPAQPTPSPKPEEPVAPTPSPSPMPEMPKESPKPPEVKNQIGAFITIEAVSRKKSEQGNAPVVIYSSYHREEVSIVLKKKLLQERVSQGVGNIVLMISSCDEPVDGSCLLSDSRWEHRAIRLPHVLGAKATIIDIDGAKLILSVDNR